MKAGAIIDNFIGLFNPGKAVKNTAIREAKAVLDYRAAKRTRLAPFKLGLGGTGDDQIKENDIWTLRELARDLDRNNVIAGAILDRATEAIVGSGLDIQISSGNKRWDNLAEKLFKNWWDTEADARGMLSGWQMEKLAYRSMKVDGDIMFVKNSNGTISAVEGDRIYTPHEFASDPNVINGVRVDGTGKPVSYYVFNAPQKTSAQKKKGTKYRTINASDAIFLANVKRFSQTRGVSEFASNMQLFDDIDAFIETCIVGAKVSVSHVLFIEKAGGAGSVEGITTETDLYGDEFSQMNVDPGTILFGNPGEKATSVGSTQPMVQFSQFVTQLLRFTGLNFGLPLEMIAMDFSKTNYSSARASMLVAHKSFLAHHKYLVKKMMEPIIRWKLKEFMDRGILFRRDNDEYRVHSTPPVYISVDPLKETKASIDKVKNGFSTNRDVCNQLGFDYSEIMNQRSREIDEAIKLANKISSKSGDKVSWRDILGATDEYNDAIFRDEEN